MAASQNLLGVLRGVVCIPPSQSDIGTLFSHESTCSLAGTEKGVNATFQNYIGTKVGKVLRCERGYCT